MSSDVGDGWEAWSKGTSRRSGPTLTVYANGNGYLNADADREWFGPGHGVVLHVNRDQDLLGLEPVEEEADDAYRISRSDSDGAGGDVNTRIVLEELGVDFDSIEEGDTTFIGLEKQGELVVADVEPLFQKTGKIDTDTASPVTDTTNCDSAPDESFDCPECDSTFDSEHGRDTHQGQAHSDSRASKGEVRDQVVGVLVDALQSGSDWLQTDEIASRTPDAGTQGVTDALWNLQDAEDTVIELSQDGDGGHWTFGPSVPDGLTEADIHALAEFLDSVEMVAEDIEEDVEYTRELLRAHGCLDDIEGGDEP